MFKVPKELANYKWSSYQHNALGKADSLVTEHPLYTGLGENMLQCCERYRNIFSMLDIAKLQSQITEATLRGEVYGGERFHHKISKLISRSTKLTSHGGDRKSEAYKEQAN